jgi:hypothetical protein
VAKGTRPSVRVRLCNPRSERVTLHRDAPVALIRIHVEAEKSSAAQPSQPASLAAPSPGTAADSAAANVPNVSSRHMSAIKRLERTHKRILRNWEKLVSEDVFRKSLRVEARFPYLTAQGNQRPKIPFGIKDGFELTMRVGLNQDSKPVKVRSDDYANILFTGSFFVI